MGTLERFISFISKHMASIAGLALIGMISLVVGNIISRSIYSPIFGTYEIVRYLGLIVAAFGLAYTQHQHGHIGVDIITVHLKGKNRAILDGVVFIFLIGLAALIVWQSVLYGIKLFETDTRSPTLDLPLYIFLFLMSICFVVFGLVSFSQLLISLRKLKE